MTNRFICAALALGGVLAAGTPTVAQAATSGCTTPTLTQPFTPFGDARNYALAPGGGFEVGDAPWRLTGGASVVAGNEPFKLRSAGDVRSLLLPAGASATSPLMCVTLDYPTFRLPVRSHDRDGQADLVIDVRYPQGADRSWKGVRAETGKAGDGWRITSDIDLKPDTYGSGNSWRMVELRFTTKAKPGAPGWQLDDVLVDPRFRR